MIILIASVSAMIAFFIGNQLSFLKPDPKGVAVPTAEAIVSDVPEADKTVFTSDAINPTIQTVIGGNATSR